MSAFASSFARAKARMSPEVAQALGVILSALFEEPVDVAAKVRRWQEEGDEHVRRTKERIKRAERAVKTRRKNAKKKVGGVKKTRPAKRRTKKKGKK